ncbi:tail fiber assembly protein [Enterobacteriaceae bacterium EKM102V]|uniref:tail fiber assembly protein n=1 Tax=Pantoea TaxID=53335 RepID=UPI00142D3067|nr:MULTISPECIES: tail fiber assembly protein [Pantoea]KAF6661246.1 tail fiber assembly protein [Enterobacteriaceae bacterium EKM102V]KAF6668244.1 tail fiber assembly protein [Pantoea sp. EKM103V]
MSGYALVKDGMVINTVVWDGETTVDFGEKVTAVIIPDENPAAPGYSYVKGVFAAPPPAAEDLAEKKQQALEDNIALKSMLISQATTAITVWQTKLLVGRKLTDGESKSLNAWLDYIDLLNAIDANTPEAIKWPDKPL